jgi:allantoate deiminase
MSSNQSSELFAYIEKQTPVIENYIDKLAEYGAQPDGGIIRPVFSPEWLAAHNQVQEWIKEAGLKPSTDGVGNLYGRNPGTESNSAVVSGSHLDTVKGGGKLDGALGILAALAAIRFLKELYGAPRRPLEVVAFCEEEGSRFTNSYIGSRAITGRMPVAELETSKDRDGISVAQAALMCGFNPKRLQNAARKDIGAFLELHIEQGAMLEQNGKALGLVQAITGQQQMRVTFTGRADHAGTTPMNMRADALVAAAEAMVNINRMAKGANHPAVATVGWITVEPGARNIVPARAEFTIDLRHSNPETKAWMVASVQNILHEAATANNVGLEIVRLMDRAPAPMSQEILSVLEAAANELNFSQQYIISGAGHDSQVMVEITPTAMLFVPSLGGRSHSSAEFTPIEQIIPGVATLALAMYKLAY